MLLYKRLKILNRYEGLQIHECPIDIIMFAATLGSMQVTIENFRNDSNSNSISILINNSDPIIQPKIKNLTADFQISRPEFIALKNTWDQQGCYAIFHDSDTLKFKASDLDEKTRYNALDHFKWTLEIAIPGSASDGWGQIASPDTNLMDQIETHILNFTNNNQHTTQ